MDGEAAPGWWRCPRSRVGTRRAGGYEGGLYPWWTARLVYVLSIMSMKATVPDDRRYPATAYGLYDPAGNSSEWCLDHFASNAYGAGSAIDPYRTDGEAMVHRGGAPVTIYFLCTAARGEAANDSVSISRGFRPIHGEFRNVVPVADDLFSSGARMTAGTSP